MEHLAKVFQSVPDAPGPLHCDHGPIVGATGDSRRNNANDDVSDPSDGNIASARDKGKEKTVSRIMARMLASATIDLSLQHGA